MNSDILIGLASGRFQSLSDNEIRILRAVESGEEAVGNGPSIVRAELLEWICTDISAVSRIRRHGLALREHHIMGLLDLIHANIQFPIQIHHCRFDSDVWLKSARLRSLSFKGSNLKGLNADSSVTETNVLLAEGFESRGEVAFRGAVIGGDLRADGGTFVGSNNLALVCDRIKVSGGVFLSRKTSPARYGGEVRFAGASVGGNFDCEGAVFENEAGTALSVERMTTSGGLFLRGARFTGIVNLAASKVEIALDCRETRIASDDERAFHAEKMSVGSHALLDGGFSCKNVHLLGIDVGGGLRCRARKIGKLDLRYAKVNAHFEWTDMVNPEESLLDLRDAMVASIKDDVQSWPKPGRLLLDGLRFERFSDCPADVSTRLRWLQLDTSHPVQAYRQLARVYQANGHPEDASTVLFTLEKRMRSNQRSIAARIWNWLLLTTIGYGYQLWRAAIFMFLLFSLGAGISVFAYRTKLVAPTDKEANTQFVNTAHVPTHYPRFSSTIFSLEHSLPGLSLGVSGSWSADTTAAWPQHVWVGPVIRSWFWLQTLLGWLLSIFFVAGISGVVKTSK
jgi:hypothetical protein